MSKYSVTTSNPWADLKNITPQVHPVLEEESDLELGNLVK